MKAYVIQPAAQAHTWNHGDYSQLGYAVKPHTGDTPKGWWRCRVGAIDIDVYGPWRDDRGRVHAMTAQEQFDWARSIGGDLPTEAEFTAMWLTACVQVAFRPRDVVTAPLWALDKDFADAIAARGESTNRVVGGKTWIKHSQSSKSRATNFGAFVPLDEVNRGTLTWKGIRVYLAPDVGDVDEAPDTLPTPAPTNPGDRGERVAAWQRYLIAYFASRGEHALPRYGADADHGGETEQWTARWRMLTGPVVSKSATTALPPISFRQAKSYYPGRKEGPPIWVVVHTAEALESSKTAENLQSWAASGPIGVSWHYAIDNDTICQSVREEHTAWAAPGANARGIQIELAGYARQSAAEWADPFSTAQLELLALLVAHCCRRHGIPARKVGPLEMLAGEPGICGHSDVTHGVGKGRTNHSDPGLRFPWSKLIARVAELAGAQPNRL